jgi:hypothetical protein
MENTGNNMKMNKWDSIELVTSLPTAQESTNKDM